MSPQVAESPTLYIPNHYLMKWLCTVLAVPLVARAGTTNPRSGRSLRGPAREVATRVRYGDVPGVGAFLRSPRETESEKLAVASVVHGQPRMAVESEQGNGCSRKGSPGNEQIVDSATAPRVPVHRQKSKAPSITASRPAVRLAVHSLRTYVPLLAAADPCHGVLPWEGGVSLAV